MYLQSLLILKSKFFEHNLKSEKKFCTSCLDYVNCVFDYLTYSQAFADRFLHNAKFLRIAVDSFMVLGMNVID